MNNTCLLRWWKGNIWEEHMHLCCKLSPWSSYYFLKIKSQTMSHLMSATLSLLIWSWKYSFMFKAYCLSTFTELILWRFHACTLQILNIVAPPNNVTYSNIIIILSPYRFLFHVHVCSLIHSRGTKFNQDYLCAHGFGTIHWVGSLVVHS